MIKVRAFFPALFSSIDTQVYVFGGFDGKHSLASCEKYSIYEDVWREIAPMNHSRSSAGVVLFKHQKFIFIMGGSGSADDRKGAQTLLESVERYDMDFDKWDLLYLQMPWRLESFTILRFEADDDNRILIVGGIRDHQ